MSSLRNFQDFIKSQIVKKQSPNKSRAEFLLKEADKKDASLKERLEKLEVTDYNAGDYVESCYNIIMLIIRAKMLTEGFNASGSGAHEAEVSYLRNLGFKENEVQFMNQIRYFRNGMLYYGTVIDKDYAHNVLGFFKQIHPKLRKLL